MIFDVMLRIGQNAAGKDVMSVARVHDKMLSDFLRKAQNDKYYIISVIPLFKKKEVVLKHIEDELDPDYVDGM